MNEDKDKTVENKGDQKGMDSGGTKDTVFLKMKARVQKAKIKTLKCRRCEHREGTVRKVATMGGKAVVGLGTGVILGAGVLSLAAVAEVAIPVLLTFKALGLTGGALGLVKGAKEFNK